MKLRFVKFFTSRENEIEKKEEGGRKEPAITCSSITSLARGQSSLPLPLLFSPLSSSFPSSSPSIQPTSPHPTAQLVGRHVPGEQCSPAVPAPAVPLLPFFFINY